MIPQWEEIFWKTLLSTEQQQYKGILKQMFALKMSLVLTKQNTQKSNKSKDFALHFTITKSVSRKEDK